MRITSPANAKIKSIRKLRERKSRQESGTYYAEGLRIVIEAVQQSAPIDALIVAPELLTSEVGVKLVEEQQQRGVEVIEVSAEVFQSIALKEDPVGIAAVLRQQWQTLAQIHIQAGDLWVALDEVADPGNLGTILRTSDAAGGKGIILLDRSTDPYDPTAIRASMGALFSQRLVKASFEEFASWKRERQVPLVGTSGGSTQDYQLARYPSGLVVLMGSERQGLDERHIQLCDQVVRIPMVGRSDSLNLAVAAGVVIYEIFNQQRKNREDSHIQSFGIS
jgi:TrmH family RNA methyltransferase